MLKDHASAPAILVDIPIDVCIGKYHNDLRDYPRTFVWQVMTRI